VTDDGQETEGKFNGEVTRPKGNGPMVPKIEIEAEYEFGTFQKRMKEQKRDWARKVKNGRNDKLYS